MQKKISEITLGTAQLGINYGIANKTGKPSSIIANKILESSLKYGINTLDTSPAYGESEQIIGSFIKKLSTEKKPSIITKIPTIKIDEKFSTNQIYQYMIESVNTSMHNLNITQIEFCLLHDPQDMTKYGNAVPEALSKLKDEGLINHLGVSVYSPQDVKEFLKFDNFDTIEVPINIFDQRLIKTRLLKELFNNKIKIFARSIFLQGLFFLNYKYLPSDLKIAEGFLKKLDKLSIEWGKTISSIAFSFIRDMEEITSVIMGVENPTQLNNNINLLKSKPLSKEEKQQIIDLFNDVPEKVIDPRKWNMSK